MSRSRNDIRDAFSAKYPAFFGQSFEFCDPPDDPPPDTMLARILLNEVAAGERLRLLSGLIEDSDRMLESLDEFWPDFHVIVNRQFNNKEEVETWIKAVKRVWQDEFSKLKT